MRRQFATLFASIPPTATMLTHQNILLTVNAWSLPRSDFLSSLPGDTPSLEQTPVHLMRFARQVPRAVYSYVIPETMPSPRLVSSSATALDLLDLSQSKMNLTYYTSGAFTSTVFPSSKSEHSSILNDNNNAATTSFYPQEQQLLIDYFSGNKLIPGSTPWSHCYGGHQFGVWAGQLGDGRAISLGEYINRHSERWELQLKGAGNTPYSRFADGLAVLRSSIREYLCSEHFFALGIPTSRAATLITSTEQLVHREELEPGAIVARLAPSWIRFGSFEIFNSRGDLANLKRLADYTSTRFFTDEVLAENGTSTQQNMYTRMFASVLERTARMISKWMAIGWEHGVMNTDNMNILGLTIDYGPFGFLDHYDPTYIVNHSDESGRYSYENQPMIALWNLNKLAIALVELCGLPELPLHVRQEMVKEGGYRNGIKQNPIESELNSDTVNKVYENTEEREKGTETIKIHENIKRGNYGTQEERKKRLERGRDAVVEVLGQYQELYLRLFTEEMTKKLGIRPNDKTNDQYKDDYNQLVKPLLNIMQASKVDFTIFFRRLCDFDPTTSASLNQPSLANAPIVDLLMSPTAPSSSINACTRPNTKLEFEWSSWVSVYSTRLLQEWSKGESSIPNQSNPEKGSMTTAFAQADKVAYMKLQNPKYILRQWIAQLVIDRAQKFDDYEAVERALCVLTDPYSDVPRGVEVFPITDTFKAQWWERWAQDPPTWGKGIVCSCSS